MYGQEVPLGFSRKTPSVTSECEGYRSDHGRLEVESEGYVGGWYDSCKQRRICHLS